MQRWSGRGGFGDVAHFEHGLPGVCIDPVGWEQIVDRIGVGARDDPGKHIAEVGVGLDVQHLAGFDQRGDRRPIFGTELVTREQRTFSLESHRPDGAFGGLVVELDPTVVEEAGEATPALQCVFHRVARRRAP